MKNIQGRFLCGSFSWVEIRKISQHYLGEERRVEVEDLLGQSPVVGGAYEHKSGRVQKGQNLPKHSTAVRESLVRNEASEVSQEVGKKQKCLKPGVCDQICAWTISAHLSCVKQIERQGNQNRQDYKVGGFHSSPGWRWRWTDYKRREICWLVTQEVKSVDRGDVGKIWEGEDEDGTKDGFQFLAWAISWFTNGSWLPFLFHFVHLTPVLCSFCCRAWDAIPKSGQRPWS